jgi:hypothetical protein
MKKWAEDAGKVVWLPPMEGWQECVLIDAGGHVIARYLARDDKVNHQIIAELWSDAGCIDVPAPPLQPLRLLG